MSETPPNTGPSHQTLRLLRDFLPSLKKGIKNGAILGKGKVSKPRKMCKVCGKLWDHIRVTAGTEVKVVGDFCGRCDGSLKDGMIALVHADKYAFVRSNGLLDDFKGTILHVSAHVMDNVERHINGEKNKVQPTATKDGNDNIIPMPGTPPSSN